MAYETPDDQAPTELTGVAPEEEPTELATVPGARGRPQQPPADTGSRRPLDLEGQRLLGRYRIGARIGAGGFGAVYRATDELKRSAGGNAEIAIKVIDTERLGDRVDVLVQEVNNSHKVTHPNILRVFDIHIDGGLAFITMELLEGDTLKNHLAKQSAEATAPHPMALPVDEVDQIAEQVCEALAYCHDQGLVHADIKPENIFLCDDGSVKVLDLGISQVIGTPSSIRGYSTLYGSPQQMAGEAPDPTDDIFALGCVLFECLAGASPLSDGSGRRSLSAIEKRDLSRLPRRYRRAVDRALKLGREEREASARRLWHRISPAVRRRRIAVVSMALAVIAGMAVATQLGPKQIPISAADQAAAEDLYQHGLDLAERNPGAAGTAWVQAIRTNPYHEAAAQRIARRVLETPFTDPQDYMRVWEDYAQAIEAAPRSQPLIDAGHELVDQTLALDAAHMPRSTVKSRFTSPLCVLPSLDYRADELERMRALLSLRC